MAKLAEIVEFLDRELKTEEIPDYDGAHNGLQLQNGGEVSTVATAVDASLPVIRKAIQQGADLLVVHHGMFWQGVRPLTGSFFKKIKEAMDAGLAIYSSHLPLDVHLKWGNNVLLAKAIGLEVTGGLMEWKGVQLGVCGTIDGNLGKLRARLEQQLGGPVLQRGEAESAPGKVGLITGGAGSEVEKVAAAGVNTFITGEGPHWSYPLAEELGINLLYGGHYATETFGVRMLGDQLSEQFSVGTFFIDHPTGL